MPSKVMQEALEQGKTTLSIFLLLDQGFYQSVNFAQPSFLFTNP